MSNAVTPDIAISYLRALNPSLKAAAVVSSQGEVLAGDATLAAAAGADTAMAGADTATAAPRATAAPPAPAVPPVPPSQERVSATRDGCTVVAVAPAGIPAVLARHDCAVAVAAVRGRC